MKTFGLVVAGLCLSIVAAAQPAADPNAPPGAAPPPPAADAGTPPVVVAPPAPSEVAAPPQEPITPTVNPPNAEDGPASEPDGEDDNRDDHQKKKKDKGAIRYKPGRYVEIRATKQTQVRLRLVVQPVARYTNVSTLKDATIDTVIRRARIGFLVKLDDNKGLRWELQIKNMHFGLSNLYGSWEPTKHIELQAGFIKAPGGLERDTYTFNDPFIERSVVADLTLDHEVGVKLSGRTKHHEQFWAVSVTRNAPQGVDGGDPEDKPVFPVGTDPDDVTRSSSKFNTSGRVGIAPSDAFEASVNVGGKFRLDDAEPDFGERVAEPYDSAFVAPRPWTGVQLRAGADIAVSQPHWRLMAEGGVRRDGQQLAIDFMTGARTNLGGHANQEMGYIVFGWTPDGHYAPAIDNAWLEDGREIIVRIEGVRAKPVDIARPITMIGVTAGYHVEVSPQLRLQADFGFQRYSSNAELTNAATMLDNNSKRYIGQVWAAWRL